MHVPLKITYGTMCLSISHKREVHRMAKKQPSQKLQAWIDARKRHRLTHAQVQMARELGMNPPKLGKMDNHDQEP